MENSRTKNTIKNVKTGIILQFINKLMSFVVRTVFIKMLNSEYLGVNGLFTNILTVLSFAELGIGTAILFNLYKPVADNNKEKIKSLMLLYKKCYRIIGTVVFLVGLCVIPFMDIIITEAPNIKENLILIYLLFLFNTASSYFLIYKSTIIYAHQKQSIINNIESLFYLSKSILEIVFLVLTKNYLVYLIIQILATLIKNILISIKANKMYPYLKDKNVTPLSKNENKNIFSNVKSLVVYKFGDVIMKGTDNILISSLVNVSTVGLCSNYTMIIQSIGSIMTAAINGVSASIGNLNAVVSNNRKEKIFSQLTFLNYIIYSFCTIAFIVLLNPFINMWLGNNYVMEMSVSIALSLSFFIEGLRAPAYTFRTTMGLFKKGKSSPYIAAITNIILSILLCKVLGVTGIYIATSIAQLVSYSWIDPYLIYKYEFKTSIKGYVKRMIEYACAFIIQVVIMLIITRYIQDTGIYSFILKIILVCIIPNFINLILFYRTEEFKALFDRFLKPILIKLKIYKLSERK